NSVTSYMLRVDEGFHYLLTEGEGSTRTLRIDPFEGEYRWEEGKNISLRFLSTGYNETFQQDTLGALSFYLFTRGGLITIGDHRYLKGPNYQPVFFLNQSTQNYYSDITNLTLMRPYDRTMKIELNYRPVLYSWFDQTNNHLSISIGIMIIEPLYDDYYFSSYGELKINYNKTETIFTTNTSTTDDFIVRGSINPSTFIPYEQVLTFEKPTGVTTYTVSIEIFGSYFLLK
ncbi:MAG: hypothetical protein U9O98_03430, partial [Asgard group archaeon]|nr:hypothetical protein [Asgard group archaeon]